MRDRLIDVGDLDEGAALLAACDEDATGEATARWRAWLSQRGPAFLAIAKEWKRALPVVEAAVAWSQRGHIEKGDEHAGRLYVAVTQYRAPREPPK